MLTLLRLWLGHFKMSSGYDRGPSGCCSCGCNVAALCSAVMLSRDKRVWAMHRTQDHGRWKPWCPCHLMNHEVVTGLPWSGTPCNKPRRWPCQARFPGAPLALSELTDVRLSVRQPSAASLTLRQICSRPCNSAPLQQKQLIDEGWSRHAGFG